MYYCQHWNGTRAAIQAGYSEKTAHVIASENLQKPYIIDEINYQLKFIMGEIQVDCDSIAREIATVAFADGDDPETTLRYGDKLKALELLGRFHQMFTDKLEIKTAADMYHDIARNAASSVKNVIKH